MVTNILYFLVQKNLLKMRSHFWVIQVWSVGPLGGAFKKEMAELYVYNIDSISSRLSLVNRSGFSFWTSVRQTKFFFIFKRCVSLWICCSIRAQSHRPTHFKISFSDSWKSNYLLELNFRSKNWSDLKMAELAEKVDFRQSPHLVAKCEVSLLLEWRSIQMRNL